MPRLLAIADTHISFKANRDEFAKLESQGPDDGLILAGDGMDALSHSIAQAGQPRN